jgi:phytanoyl-CoA hydroxylase
MRILSAAQKQRFESDGFLMVDDVLTASLDIARVLDEYAVVLDEIASRLWAEGVIRSAYADLPFPERLIQVCAESGRALPQDFDFSLPQSGISHETPIHVGPAVFGILTSPRLLDLVEDIIGPEMYSNPVQHIRMKLPKRAIPQGCTNGLVTQIPWHQDNGVIMPEADDASILTVWLPLTPATVDNGCLQVIPRSHRDGLAEHCPGGSVHIPDGLVPVESAVPVPMQPGSVLLMTQRTIHSSLDNVTDDQVRISMDLRYQPIGQATGRPAFASAGFVARSRAHPELVLDDPAEWARRWLSLRDELAERENPTFNRWSAEAAVCA